MMVWVWLITACVTPAEIEEKIADASDTTSTGDTGVAPTDTIE